MSWQRSVVLGCVFSSAVTLSGAGSAALANRFDQGAEGWQVYDYNGGSGPNNAFFPVTWEKERGVRNSGYIWGDDSRWRVDTPEEPHSILAFIIYRSWIKGKPLDLRKARVSVALRGDNLNLKGAKCYFWALNGKAGTRWHYTSKPLPIALGKWDKPVSFVLENNEKLWHRSWSRHPDKPASLDQVLHQCDSYGFSFLGFSGEVTGKFSMDELEIHFAGK